MIKFEMPENKDEDRQYKEGLIKLFSNYKKGEIASDNFIQEIKNKAIFLNKEKYEEAVMGFWPENLESLLNLSFAVYNENLRIYINKDEIPKNS